LLRRISGKRRKSLSATSVYTTGSPIKCTRGGWTHDWPFVMGTSSADPKRRLFRKMFSDLAQVVPVGVPVGLAEHSCTVPQNPGLKERSGGCQLKAASAILGKYSVSCQHPHEPIE
jgi:hypothetical protein